MQRLRLEELEHPSGRDCVTLGNFDGVHLGHQRLVAAVLAAARANAGRAVVATFDPHPTRILGRRPAPASLMSFEQKAEALESLGVERLVTVPFDRRLAAMDAESFARDVLRGRLGAGTVVIGKGFRFGRGRGGDADVLRRIGLGVVEVDPELEGRQPISSTRIRAAVAEGDVEGARRMLGRPFATDGLVVTGDRRGRALGLPTANVDPENEAVPARGVYAARCRIRELLGWGTPLKAVVNVGERPTFAGSGRRIEAHLLGFEADIYGRRLRIEYHARLREERRFESARALVEQVREDAARASELLENA
jgi:riboflavin kinase/FMN adenylyltransferase